MLVIDAQMLNEVAERLCIVAREARDEGGLRVMVDLPRFNNPASDPDDVTSGILASGTDFKRCRAIALAAIVSLTGETCRISDEHHFGGWPLSKETEHGAS